MTAFRAIHAAPPGLWAEWQGETGILSRQGAAVVALGEEADYGGQGTRLMPLVIRPGYAYLVTPPAVGLRLEVRP